MDNLQFMQILKQSDEEKLQMYLKCSKEELAKMLIESNKHVVPMTIAGWENDECISETFRKAGVDIDRKNWRKVLAWQMPLSKVLIWDWKGQPDISEVNEYVQEGLHYFYEVPDTGGDNYAWVVTAVPLEGEDQVQKIYDNFYNSEFDEIEE